MHRFIILSALVLGLSVAAGCTFANSAMGGNTSKTNEAWFTEVTYVLGIPVSTRVYYCPPMGSGGPSICTEAELNETAPPAPAAPAAAPVTAPTPAPGGEGATEGGE